MCAKIKFVLSTVVRMVCAKTLHLIRRVRSGCLASVKMGGKGQHAASRVAKTIVLVMAFARLCWQTRQQNANVISVSLAEIALQSPSTRSFLSAQTLVLAMVCA